jgi:hypothetical protein
MLAWESVMVGEIRDIFFAKLGSSQTFNQEIFESENVNINDPQAQRSNVVIDVQNPVVGAGLNTDVSTNTDTSSSTESFTPTVVQEPIEDNRPTYDPRDFKDIIISNKDTRAIVNSNGEVIFFYSILDQENVLITTNRATLDIVLDKINVAKLIR